MMEWRESETVAYLCDLEDSSGERAE
ncbi:hypothetical protein AVEN_77507-1, partial [Araneus ventricosus]